MSLQTQCGDSTRVEGCPRGAVGSRLAGHPWAKCREGLGAPVSGPAQVPLALSHCPHHRASTSSCPPAPQLGDPTDRGWSGWGTPWPPWVLPIEATGAASRVSLRDKPCGSCFRGRVLQGGPGCWLSPGWLPAPSAPSKSGPQLPGWRTAAAPLHLQPTWHLHFFPAPV